MKPLHRSLFLSLGLTLVAGCVVDTTDDGAPNGEVVYLDKGAPEGKADSVTSRYVMHFFPGLQSWDGRSERTGVMLLAKNGEYIFAVPARGGPEVRHGTAGATPKGSYAISQVGPKQGSNRWPMSLVQWGSVLAVDENEQGRVTAVYERYTNMAGQTAERQIDNWKLGYVNTRDFSRNMGLVFHDTDQSGTIEDDERTVGNMHFASQVRSGTPIYTNDFGHMSAYLGRNGVYLHPTSPMYHESDGQPTDACSTMSGQCRLADSHGCIHVAPPVLDYLIGSGWLRRGTNVVVHGYDESPPAEAAELIAGLAEEVDAQRWSETERNVDCACDYNDNVCEAALKGTVLTCECDVDCYQGEHSTACNQDGRCDTWCPASVDPDCR